jgi:hypothetical protein
MSLNGYSWVEGNVVNAVDPSGMIYELPSLWDSCADFQFVSGQICPDPENPFCGFTVPGTRCPASNPFCDFTIQPGNQCPLDNPLCGLYPPGTSICPLDNLLCLSSTIPGHPFAQYTNAQLAQMCRQGNGVFNAACAELLRRCNQNIAPVLGDIDPCTGRNTCDSTRQAYHRRRKDLACKTFARACNSATPCPVIYINILLIQNCLLARQTEVNECFQGIADESHDFESFKEEYALHTCLEELIKPTGSGRPCIRYGLPGGPTGGTIF